MGQGIVVWVNPEVGDGHLLSGGQEEDGLHWAELSILKLLYGTISVMAVYFSHGHRRRRAVSFTLTEWMREGGREG